MRTHFSKRILNREEKNSKFKLKFSLIQFFGFESKEFIRRIIFVKNNKFKKRVEIARPPRNSFQK